MRRVVATLVFLAALVAVASSAAAAPRTATLADTSDPGSFPFRSWVLTLPKARAVNPERVRVSEDGRDVRDLRVAPAGTAGGGTTAGTVLVIDASESMHDAPIAGAMRAARAFARTRRQNQALGVILFDEDARVILRPTTDAAAIERALARRPDLGHGTHINDAVGTGLQLLRDSGIETGSLVVMSDGDDTGSRSPAAALVAAARRAHVRIFTVGLASRVFTPRGLERLAAPTGGTAAVAGTPRSLEATFAGIAARLSAEFVVHYRSREPAGERVRVSIDLDGDGGAAEATADYDTPEAALAVAPGSTSRDSFWTSTAAMAGVAAVIALMIALALAMAFRPRGQLTVGDRIAAYTADRPPTPSIEERGNMLAAAFERTVSATKVWARFVEEVDVARVRQSPTQLALGAAAGLLVMSLLSQLAGSAVFGVLAVAIPVATLGYVRVAASRQRRAFTDLLADNLQVFASALRAGHSFTGALGTVIGDAPEPTRREFSRALADERLGVPVDEAMTRIGHRMRSKDMAQVAMIAALQQETGGNTAEVLDRVIENIRERQELRRLVRSLTAQGRISQMVVTALPFGLAGLISVLNPGYLRPLVESSSGRIALGVSLGMVMLGSFAIHKIVNIKV